MTSDERREEYEALAAIPLSPGLTARLDARRQRYVRSPTPDSPQNSTTTQNPLQFQEGGSQPQSHRPGSENPSFKHETGEFGLKNDPAALSPTISQVSFASMASRAGLEAAKGAAKWARSLWSRSGSGDLSSTGTAEQPQDPDISDRGTAQSHKSQKLPSPESYDWSEQANSADRYSGDESD